MATIYPSGIDTNIDVPLATDNLTSVNANFVNTLRAAIIAIESELGVKPSTVYTTVRNRLDNLESLVDSIIGQGGQISGNAGGDLTGTYPNPLVVSISGTSPILIKPANLQFKSTTPSPIITQGIELGDIATNSFTIAAQSANTSASININGGASIIQGGAATNNGTTGRRGGVKIQLGADSAETLIEVVEPVIGQRVVSLAQIGSGITSTQMPNNTGDGIVYIANAHTNPTASPVNGAILYSSNGNLNIYQSNGHSFQIMSGIDTVAGLRTIIGADNTQVIMGGYHSVGDGGGGTFFWDISSSTGDNNGTIIVPTGSTTGRWVRIYSSPINAKWFGAYGDNTHDDTAAIQSAVNFVQGTKSSILLIPTGNYILTGALNNTAIYINQECQIHGEGIGKTNLFINGPTTGILIEQYGTFGSQNSAILDMTITSYATPLARDLIVIHAPQIRVENVALSSCQRFGILIESGTVTGDSSGGLYGTSLAPNGFVMDSDQFYLNGIYIFECPSFVGQVTTLSSSFVQPPVVSEFSNGHVSITVPNTALIDNCPVIVIGASGEGGGGLYSLVSIDSMTGLTIANTGNPHGAAVGATVSSGASVQIGSAIYCHGSDSQSSIGQLISSVDSNVTISDFSLGGNTWIECYSQDSNVGYFYGSSFESIFLRCGSEDTDAIVIGLGSTPLLIGGVLAGYANQQTTNGFYAVSGQNSVLGFSQDSVDHTVNYDCAIPNSNLGTSITLGRTAAGIQSVWSNSYQYDTYFGFPYLFNSFMWKHFANGALDTDICGGPFGWTDYGHSRGVGLPMIAAPTINTQRHWTWRQAVTLASGYNLVYLNGGLSGDAGQVPFLDDAKDVVNAGACWPHTQRSIKFSIEYSSAAALTAANVGGGCYVAGYSFIQESAGPPATWNAVASVFNGTGSSTAITLIWNFDTFVPNYDSGSIG